MKLYYEDKFCKLYNGDMLDMVDSGCIKPMSIDCIVTDPPYELNFMNKGWDNAGVSFSKETWKKCFDILKPGGYLLAFGGSRTFHRIACAIEDAGFEIRDTIMWIFGSGFPKSLNLGKMVDKKQGNERIKTGRLLHHAQKGVAVAEERGAVGGGSFGISHDEEETVGTTKWEGWGTALKPSYEPIIIARKPCEGTCVDNVLKYGVGGLNIDECRVGNETIKGGTIPDFRDIGQKSKEAIGIDKLSFGQVENAKRKPLEEHTGRFPANTILTYDETDYDEVCGGFPSSDRKNGTVSKVYDDTSNIYGDYKNKLPFESYGDSGSASRYFYCAKASKKDRNDGCEYLQTKTFGLSNQAKAEIKRGNNDFSGDSSLATNALNKVQHTKNNHPTVKPTSLMQYIIRLVAPKGATVLDPFMGSGSTGKACAFENRERDADYKFVGIELTDEYLPIAEARIKWAENIEFNEDVLNTTNEEPQKEATAEEEEVVPVFEKFDWGIY